MENLKKSFQEQVLQNFKQEIFFWLKIFLAIALLIFWFLFWRIYENSNLLNFLWDKNDNYTFIEIEKISEKWIDWKVNFWSLKILKDWKKISLDAGKFFIKNK